MPIPQTPVQRTFPGFDTDAYPGDPHMRVWKASSPYVFTSYYLHATCHGDRGWMGHRAALAAMGWNAAPVYVGQQVAGTSPCQSSVLTLDQGRLDAQDCAETLAAEGFAPGCFVYLDVERSDLYPSALADYISAWVKTLTGAGFGPGVYCHRHNASDVRDTVLAALTASQSVKPRFWIAGGSPGAFDIHKSHPADSGIGFADMWQCPVSVNRTFGGVTINLDEDIAAVADPAKPDPAASPVEPN